MTSCISRGDAHAFGIGGQPGLGFAFAFQQAVALPNAPRSRGGGDGIRLRPGSQAMKHDRRTQRHDDDQRHVLAEARGAGSRPIVACRDTR